MSATQKKLRKKIQRYTDIDIQRKGKLIWNKILTSKESR